MSKVEILSRIKSKDSPSSNRKTPIQCFDEVLKDHTSCLVFRNTGETAQFLRTVLERRIRADHNALYRKLIIIEDEEKVYLRHRRTGE